MPFAFNYPGLTPLRAELPPNHQREQIAFGNRGTAQTISRMQELVTEGKRDQRIRPYIGKILATVPAKDYYRYAEAIYKFARDKIRYAFDPVGVELVESPYRILEAGIADCDSIVMLLATMCESIGLPSQFVTIKADLSRPEEFSHVYLRVKIPRHGWIAADATMPQHDFGWEPDKKYPRKYWPASKDPPDEHEDDVMGFMSGMRFLAEGPVPRVVDAPTDVVSHVGDWRQPRPMDDGIGMRAETSMFGMGALGLESDDVTIRKVIDGSLYNDLVAARRKQMERNAEVIKRKMDVEGMPAGSAKDEAWALWTKANAANQAAKETLQAAIEKYNEIARSVRSITFGAVTPNLAGMGIVWTPALIVAALIGGGIAISALSGLVANLWGHQEAARGYLDQLASAIRAGGGVVHEVTGLTQTLLIGAAVLGGGYLLYRVFKKRGSFG